MVHVSVALKVANETTSSLEMVVSFLSCFSKTASRIKLKTSQKLANGTLFKKLLKLFGNFKERGLGRLIELRKPPWLRAWRCVIDNQPKTVLK